MTIVPVPYTLRKFGAKRFTVEWILDPQNTTDVYIGDRFDAVDCDLVSVYAISAADLLCKLYGSNLHGAIVDPAYGLLSNISGHVALPSALGDIYYPPMRLYWPTAEDVVGISRVALLFESL